MAASDIDELNVQIRRAGADWVAGETTYSRFVAADNPGDLLGLALTPEEAFADLLQQRENEQRVLFGAGPPPPAPPLRIDWRNHNGQNWVTRPKDQKGCGSCVSFATCGVLEGRLRIETDNPELNVDLSEAHLFYCGAPDSCSTGWLPAKAMQFARATGIGREDDFPYTPHDQACRMIDPVIKIVGYREAATSVERKRALLGGPVVASMAVYRDFFSYQSGVYRHVAGELAGYHAVCVVGYDDDGACWIVKNSWGNGWGEEGFFRIRYGECGFDTQFPFTVPGRVVVQPGVHVFA